MTRTLPCIVCSREITTEKAVPEEVLPEGWSQNIHGATSFYTFGHYGSMFWDSFVGGQCCLNVCDECLRKNKDKLAFIRKIREHRDEWKEFDPETGRDL